MELDQIKCIIEEHIESAEVYVLDPMNDGQHLQAIVISKVFNGVSLVKQHQMVMRPLKDALAGEVHALGLKTFTPEKWLQNKHQYGF